ncbi:MAG: di-trans,poly-cis-decaprenylcistransferase [Deferribacteraceae bacterium]|nr:di-trans,poly-cis-decaprenylcistransferase [Deferribacteraceae bacterium]
MHVGIIMDRNGEWAKRRTLTRLKGHYEGVKAIRRTIEASVELGVDVLSLFAFSTENWLRPADEVSFLMRLVEEFIASEGKQIIENGVKVIISGKPDRIPHNAQTAINALVQATKHNDRLIVNVALDYGGRDEIASACQKIAERVQKGEIAPIDIDEQLFSEHLFQPTLPDIDLLIRTGNVQRISNFMLWQLAYTEFYFTDALWPDFSKADLQKALDDFHSRQRRFGKTSEQLDG